MTALTSPVNMSTGSEVFLITVKYSSLANGTTLAVLIMGRVWMKHDSKCTGGTACPLRYAL